MSQANRPVKRLGAVKKLNTAGIAASAAITSAELRKPELRGPWGTALVCVIIDFVYQVILLASGTYDHAFYPLVMNLREVAALCIGLAIGAIAYGFGRVSVLKPGNSIGLRRTIFSIGFAVAFVAVWAAHYRLLFVAVSLWDTTIFLALSGVVLAVVFFLWPPGAVRTNTSWSARRSSAIAATTTGVIALAAPWLLVIFWN
jgi:hypothetical protein